MTGFCFQEKSRMCKNDILDRLWPARRHLKPDQSWRGDWKHYCAGIPLTPHHDVCQEDRAFEGTVRFEHLSHFGNCHEGRAFASTALVEHLPHSGNCHEGPARGVRKVTTGITGLWQPSVHSDVAF